MLKTRKRWISLLLTLAMVVAFCMPLAGTALAAGTSYALETAIVTLTSSGTATTTPVAQVLVDINPVSVTGSSTALVEVADSGGSLLGIDVASTLASGVSILAGSADVSSVNLVGVGTPTYVSSVGKYVYNTAKLTINTSATGLEAKIGLTLYVNPASAASGDIKEELSNATGNLVSGTIAVATVGTGSLAASVLTEPAFGDSGGTATIRVEENVAGGMTSGKVFKFKLPNGFQWYDGSTTLTGSSYFSGVQNCDESEFSGAVDGRTLSVKFTTNATYTTTGTVIIVDITVPIEIEDLSVAKTGEVDAALSGDDTWSPSSDIAVGTYGDYTVTATDVDTKTVEPGLYGQELGKWQIAESLQGSLQSNRSIIITLPENVKWDNVTESDPYPTLDSSDSSNINSFNIGSWTAVGSDGREIRATISQDTTSGGTATKATTIVFKSGYVTAEADFTGDVSLTLSGSAGATGTVKVGTATASITATAASKASMVIGSAAQAAGNVTVTEGYASALVNKDDFSEAAYLRVKLPAGVSFASNPTFTVTSGDVELGDVTVDSDSSNWAEVEIKGESATAATITISGISLTVDRTVPAGDIDLKIGGNALVDNDDNTNWDSGQYVVNVGGTGIGSTAAYFDGDSYVASVPIGTVTTSASTSTSGTAVFKIGQSSYTLNGNSVTMDVAPYIKDGRTYLPLRFAANSLGVIDANINYANGTATVIKDGLVVQFVVGSTTMTVNNSAITMDAVPENVSGRVMVPIRWLGQALGATFTWDATAQTVTATY